MICLDILRGDQTILETRVRAVAISDITTTGELHTLGVQMTTRKLLRTKVKYILRQSIIF